VATTDDALGGGLLGKLPGSTATRCLSVTLEDDAMYVLGKDVDGGGLPLAYTIAHSLHKFSTQRFFVSYYHN
jgi:hypothetical protein